MIPSTRLTETTAIEPLAQDLREWRMLCGRPSDNTPVIPNTDGAVMSDKSFNNWRSETFGAALERAGLPRARPYDLRHSFASLLLHEGHSVVYVACQLGHGANLTHSTYAHVIDELDSTPSISAEDAIRAARTRAPAQTSAR